MKQTTHSASALDGYEINLDDLSKKINSIVSM